MTEWDRRELCSDGGCVGVIGADGLCKVCGRAAQNWGDERRRGLVVPEDEEEEEDDDDEDGEEDDEDGDEDGDDHEGDEGDADDDLDDASADSAAEPAPDPDSDRAYEWSRRRLCTNGACVGIVGENGKCRVCGKAP